MAAARALTLATLGLLSGAAVTIATDGIIQDTVQEAPVVITEPKREVAAGRGIRRLDYVIPTFHEYVSRLNFNLYINHELVYIEKRVVLNQYDERSNKNYIVAIRSELTFLSDYDLIVEKREYSRVLRTENTLLLQSSPIIQFSDETTDLSTHIYKYMANNLLLIDGKTITDYEKGKLTSINDDNEVIFLLLLALLQSDD